jgi:HEAT repeat protein
MPQSEQTTLLIEMLANPRGKPGQRAQAARLLGESGDPAAIRPLIQAIEDTADPFKLPVVTAALAALPRFGAAAIAPYREVLAGDDTMRRPYMPRLLVETGDPGVVSLLLDCLHDRQPDVVINAITALGSVKTPQAFDALLAILDDPGQPPAMRGVAASALGTTGDPRAFEPLAALLHSGDRQLLGGAIDGLAELGDERAVEPLRALLARGDGALDESLERGVQLALISLSARRRERERGLR